MENRNKDEQYEHQATIYPIASCPAKSYGILGISLLLMEKKMADHLPHRVQPAKKWRNTRNIRVRDEKVQRREQEPREEVTRFAGWRPAWC